MNREREPLNYKEASMNTDKEIWRKVKDDVYSPSIHTTYGGGIGINVGGNVIVLPVEKWHALADRIIAEEGKESDPHFTFTKEEIENLLKQARERAGYEQQPKLPEKLRLDIGEDTQHQICGIEYFLSQLLDYLKARLP